MEYEIGKQFPLNQYLGTEGVYPIFTNGSFDLLVIISSVSEESVNIFREGKLRYKWLHFSLIPYMSITYEKRLELGCYFNIYWIKNRNISAWLQLAVTRTVNLFLVDQKDYILKSMRVIHPPGQNIKALKEILELQYKKYKSTEEVDDNEFSKFYRSTVDKMMLKWKVQEVI